MSIYSLLGALEEFITQAFKSSPRRAHPSTPCMAGHTARLYNSYKTSHIAYNVVELIVKQNFTLYFAA
jgi:hypothetical protein